MENQFVDEPIEKEPDLHKSYNVSPITTSNGLTHLMKLILCAKYDDICTDIINKKIKDDPKIINEQCSIGWTPLMIACRNSNTYSSVKIVKLLLSQSNIDINKQEGYGWTALMMLCRYSNTDSNIETIKLLSGQPNTDINKQNNNGWTSLMVACRNSNTDSNIETVKLLLGQPNIDVNKQNNNGWTALMIACRYSNTDSNIETVKLLLNHPSIDINKQNKEGLTVLEIIHDCGNVKNIRGNMENILGAFYEFISNNCVHFNKNTLKILTEKSIPRVDLLMPNIFCPLDFDYSLVGNILINIDNNNKNKDKFIYYCYLHTNIKKEILKNISDQKEQMYCKPNNIIALCSEINFNLKFKASRQIFEELNDKLKFIFDIKDEFDMVNKISFYL